jgi:acetyl esterase/lipase
VNRRLREQAATAPPTHTRSPTEVREERVAGTGRLPPPVYLPQGRNDTAPGRDGPVTVRVFTPEAVDGVYLHLHGGGWVFGGADMQDQVLWDLAEAASVAVVSVDYRLAPEHPFPAGPEDCEDVAAWLVEHGRERFGVDRYVIGGTSAGAHLAALTLLRLRSRFGSVGPFRGANLCWGAFDLGMTPSQRLWGEDYLVIATPAMNWFYGHFLPGTTPEQRRHPSVSPLYADLAGMPPARFVVGTLDPLVDDTLFMEARWRTAGAPTRLEIVPEGVHGFANYPSLAGDISRAREIDFIRAAVLGAAPEGGRRGRG